MKKLLAICLTFIMVISVLAVPAFAATVEVQAKTFFDQSFANLTEAPAGWTIVGSPTYTETGVQTGHAAVAGRTNIGFNEAFNAGKADYTLTARLAHMSNIQYLHFGADTAANAVAASTDVAGYTFYATMSQSGATAYKSGVYELYKNGEKIADFTDANTSYGYQNLRDFSFEVTDDAIIVAGPFTGSPVTVADATPVKSGYVGLTLANNNSAELQKCKLASMSLKADAYSYEVDASQKTTGAYAANDVVVEGQEYVNVPDTAVGAAYNDSTIVVADNITVPADMDVRFTADIEGYAYRQGTSKLEVLGYTFKFTTAALSDSTMTVTLNDGTADVKTVTINRSDLSTGKTGSTEVYYYGLMKYVVDITPSKITLTVAGNEILSADIAERHNSGRIAFLFKNYNAKNKKFQNAVLETLDKTVTNKKTDFILDKTFTSADNADSLAALGFTASGSNLNYTDSGIYCTRNGYLTYTGAKLGGAYTAEYVTYKQFQETTSYLNASADFKNAYKVKAVYNIPVAISKIVDGTETALELSAGAGVNPGSGIHYVNQLYKVTVEPQDNGDVKIIASIGDKIWEATDVKTEENAPYTEGYFRLFQMTYDKESYIKSVKAYPTSVGTPAFEGKFDIGGNVASAAAKGVTYFTFPVTMLGQAPDFIAALYEDGKMSDIKFFDVDDVNAGPVELFDTTASTANKVEIKVFVWNTLEGMVPVLAPFTLD